MRSFRVDVRSLWLRMRFRLINFRTILLHYCKNDNVSTMNKRLPICEVQVT